ncbi:MAG: hypothetical protein WCV99_06235 [Sterolibacterium sp.]|jgi:hypothetical protein
MKVPQLLTLIGDELLPQAPFDEAVWAMVLLSSLRLYENECKTGLPENGGGEANSQFVALGG